MLFKLHYLNCNSLIKIEKCVTLKTFKYFNVTNHFNDSISTCLPFFMLFIHICCYMSTLYHFASFVA